MSMLNSLTFYISDDVLVNEIFIGYKQIFEFIGSLDILE